MHAVSFSDDRRLHRDPAKTDGSCRSVNGWFQREGRQPFSSGSALNAITNFRIETLSSEAASLQISGIPPSIDTFPASAKCQQEFRRSAKIAGARKTPEYLSNLRLVAGN